MFLTQINCTLINFNFALTFTPHIMHTRLNIMQKTKMQKLVLYAEKCRKKVIFADIIFCEKFELFFCKIVNNHFLKKW
jgi:hypothetical protein